MRVMLLAGSDLIATMSEPGVWSADDVRIPGFSQGYIETGSLARPYFRSIWHIHH